MFSCTYEKGAKAFKILEVKSEVFSIDLKSKGAYRSWALPCKALISPRTCKEAIVAGLGPLPAEAIV